ncbi:serine/threonine-protein kinase sepA-like protein [Carex littledalei]|uniref:non-specific serine/threonine protein kinase n=1 Tax=Carex littledalei TaxID=544730 RepID=A0A833QW00_9POAL|nr:serine/threonine-protein kinase sepA-like protein [Carex littledalei]
MSRHVSSTAHFHKSRTLDDKYILGDEIGKGAYGRVYKGLDLANGDFVAIKQVSLENIPQEDLSIIMNLNHKNIVKYLGSLKTKAHLHIILEYVENGSLANIIKPNKFGPFPESLVAVYITQQVLEGLVYLHEQGVIHRDIKGANILTTKEGLVKLADFGVATKLTEADINTHSVVGTPYWMAPEVIEMSGVCAASDIWSVGCTVIELLTCVPPYYDLQPMPALFRIVQDESPPIPEGLSPEITDFLRLCFKKDAMQRPDAKTLLMHPWIQNSRRTPPSYLRDAGALRNIEEVDDDSSRANRDSVDSPKGEKRESATSQIENEDSGKKLSDINSPLERDKSAPKHTEGSTSNGIFEHPKDAQASMKEPQKLSLPSDGRDEMVHETRPSSHEISPDHVPNNGVQELQKADLRNEGLGGRRSGAEESDAFSFGSGRNNSSFRQLAKYSTPKEKTAVGDLSRFSDSPNDAVLDDLFHPLDQRGQGNEASTSGTSRDNDLASELKNRMAQKQKEIEQVGPRSGGLLKMVMDMQDDVDIASVFDENMPAESIFPLQSVEFNKVVGLLKPEEPEQVIIPACQKLTVFFTRRPETKETFMSQHGFLQLIELLDLKKPQITVLVLQIINHLIKDNITFQENACLVGLIPVVMNLATPKESREVRMQAAFFFQQLCQSSTQTLQMFIACRGIPTLVNLLEPDYAKYREMVHLAIDGIWQVFKLQQSTLRKDFCRIAAKSGIFNRLVITLHSLNEATRLAGVSGSGVLALTQNGLKPLPRPRSGQLEIQTHSSHSGQLDVQRSLRPGSADLDGSPKFNDTAAGANPRRSSIDRSPRHSELMSNGGSGLALPHQSDHVRPLLSLLEKEMPSRQVSGQLDYMRHLSGLERHESILPLLHASTTERKPNGELELLMAEFAEVSRQGRENGNHLESNTMKHLHRTASKSNYMTSAVAPGASSNEGASTSGIASQTASGVLSGSGVLNARPGSTTSSGILSQMVSSMSADVAREYLEKAADLLLEFAQADSVVKGYLCVQSLMIRLFQMFNKIEPPILLKILKCINHLSTDPNCLEILQRSDAIKHLIPNLELRDGPLVSQIHNEVLNALFNLCKINKRRQEQAAENGIIPHLMNFIMSDSPLKQYALPLLCDMAHASRNSREQLRAHGGLDVYLSLLEDEAWAGTALDSIAVCLAHDNELRKVEQALLKKDAIQKLVKYFQNCPGQYFVNILEPFLKIITKSSRINTVMATSGLTTLLIARLDHQDAIARLNLLKLIKAVYEHHPRPKQLIVENDLPQKLTNLIEERRDGQRSGGQVLVKQMATALLKALHINTVL